MPNPATKLCAPFIAALQEDRDALNARFALRLRGGRQIDADAFSQHLQRSVSPLIEQIHEGLPERTRSAVTALYDVSLDLFVAGLLGPDAKMIWVQRVWTELLPTMAKVLAREPQQVAGCLCNAAFQIASQAGAQPQIWIERMQLVAPHCRSASELLEAGKVAAWQAGMVQFRAASLDSVGGLRAPLSAVALGLPESTSAEEIIQRVSRMRDQLWLSVEAAGNSEPAAQINYVASVGAFVGFGGLFLRPPIVDSDGERLLVTDGQAQWALIADRYGTWFQRVGPAPATRQKSSSAANVSVDRQGTIRWRKQSLAAPHLAQVTSTATCGQTLAVTIPTSHHVFLFSATGAGR